MKNCKSFVELPKEMSRLNLLEELVLCGCSKLESLNMDLEHHQGRRLHQSCRTLPRARRCDDPSS